MTEPSARVLVFNVGSTTLKFACIDAGSGGRLTDGTIDRIGQADGDAADHLTAARQVLARHEDLNITAIGHRVVQGGDRFTEPTRVDDRVRRDLAELDSLAPLHNPPARRVVDFIARERPDSVQVLVFDTAYYASLTPSAFRYAVPEAAYRDHGVRRYGMHGTSHGFVVRRAIDFLASAARAGDPSDRSNCKIITLHLGGGASATASIGGVAVDTSMGMTPLEGLVMATRCGDIDASVPLHLMRSAGMSPDEVDRLLNKQSGLLGLCGEADMRRVLQKDESGDPEAALAIDIYVRRLHKYIGAYFAILGGLDALVFTAGIGENAALIRRRVVDPLAHLGVKIDGSRNELRHDGGSILDLSASGASARTLVVPTDEEQAIVAQVARLITESA